DVELHDSPTSDSGKVKQGAGYASITIMEGNEQLAYERAEKKALEGVLDAWHSDNHLPNGTVHVAVGLFESSGVFEKNIDTDSWNRWTRGKLETAAMVVPVAAMFVPGLNLGAAAVFAVNAGVTALMAEGMYHSIKERYDSEGGLK